MPRIVVMSAQTTSPRVPEWTFADRLRKARRQLGLTQREFAEKIEADPRRYAQWENDANLPRDLVQVAQRVEREAGVPAAWLIGLPWIGPAPDGTTVTRQKHQHGSHLQLVDAA